MLHDVYGKAIAEWSGPLFRSAERDAVREPAAVRYACASNPKCNLVNAAGVHVGHAT